MTIQTGRAFKKVFTLLLFHLFVFMPAKTQAQATFTERLQNSQTGTATVTLHQSADIDRLVNSEVLVGKQPAAAAPGSTPKQSPQASAQQPANAAGSAAVQSPEQEQSPVDQRRVVKGVKVMGYRVQAFAGGHSRNDRQTAEQTGSRIKAQFKGVPVYVHFQSPRWLCRVGNYRTYEEAHQMLTSLKKAGFNQASIVKTKIIVAY